MLRRYICKTQCAKKNFPQLTVDEIWVAAVTLVAGLRYKEFLTQKSQVVFAALMHVRCLLEAPHLLRPVASHCHFVGSSYKREETVLYGEELVSMF